MPWGHMWKPAGVLAVVQSNPWTTEIVGYGVRILVPNAGIILWANTFGIVALTNPEDRVQGARGGVRGSSERMDSPSEKYTSVNAYKDIRNWSV